VDSYDRVHHDETLRYMKDKLASLMTNREIEAALHAGTANSNWRRPE
jgi:hypothetical protein